MKIEFILVLWLIMWLFNHLEAVKQPWKDIVNGVVIVLLIVGIFVYGLFPG